jgi:hypothetical protein
MEAGRRHLREQPRHSCSRPLNRDPGLPEGYLPALGIFCVWNILKGLLRFRVIHLWRGILIASKPMLALLAGRSNLAPPSHNCGKLVIYSPNLMRPER